MKNPTKTEATEEKIWPWIHAIPRGKVATYGQIAALAGQPRHARLVGRIMGRLPQGTKLPWHRVINAQGRLSSPNKQLQQSLLEVEGVTFIGGRVNLKNYQWRP